MVVDVAQSFGPPKFLHCQRNSQKQFRKAVFSVFKLNLEAVPRSRLALVIYHCKLIDEASKFTSIDCLQNKTGSSRWGVGEIIEEEKTRKSCFFHVQLY